MKDGPKPCTNGISTTGRTDAKRIIFRWITVGRSGASRCKTVRNICDAYKNLLSHRRSFVSTAFSVHLWPKQIRTKHCSWTSFTSNLRRQSSGHMVLIPALAPPSASIMDPLRIRTQVRRDLSTSLSKHDSYDFAIWVQHIVHVEKSSFTLWCSSHFCLIEVNRPLIWLHYSGSLILLLNHDSTDKSSNLEIVTSLNLVPIIWLS